MRIAITIAIACGSLASLSSTAARAQTTPDREADRITTEIEDRRDSTARSRAADDGSPWYLSVGSPIKFNSNIANSETGTLSAAYIDPSVALGRSWELGGAELTFEAGADAQFFSAHTANNNATIYANSRISVSDGKFKPYFDYTGLSIYDGFFDSHAITLHQFTLGGTTAIPLSETDKLALNIGVVRREASVASAEWFRGELSLKFVHTIDAQSGLSLSARGRLSDFTGGTMVNRTDKHVRLAAVYTNQPSDAFGWDFGVSFERNWSNTAGKDYSVWDIGPSFTFTF